MWRRLASLLCAVVLFLAGLVVATEVHADLAKKTVIALDPSASAAAVPEPMTPALFGGGLVGLAGLLRRQRTSAR